MAFVEAVWFQLLDQLRQSFDRACSEGLAVLEVIVKDVIVDVSDSSSNAPSAFLLLPNSVKGLSASK